MDRTCRKCAVTNPPRGFYTAGASVCRRCRDQRRTVQWRERYRSDPDFREAANHRGGKNVYNGPRRPSVRNHVEDLREQQAGVCAVCARARELVVDHDHKTCHPGRRYCADCIRGLLCSNCNTGLGLFEDNPAFLQGAIAYLARRL